MIGPVPSSIQTRSRRNEGQVGYRISVDFVEVEEKEKAEGKVCKGGMCMFGENVMVRKTPEVGGRRGDEEDWVKGSKCGPSAHLDNTVR